MYFDRSLVSTYSIDYIGLWNERSYTKAYILELRKQLDTAKLTHVKIVGTYFWTISLQSNPSVCRYIWVYV